MKIKNYDDDVLVKMLGLGTISYGEIALEVRLSTAMVKHIAAGRCRSELLPRIAAARRKNIRRAEKRTACLERQLAKARTVPSPESRKRGNYDDDLLVDLLAQGKLTFSQIADKAKLHKSSVRRIASGAARADLQPAIRQAELANIRRTRRIGAHNMPDLLQMQVDLGREGRDDLARKCREFVIKTFLDLDDDGPQPQSIESQIPTFMKLSPETQARVVEDLRRRESGCPQDEVAS